MSCAFVGICVCELWMLHDVESIEHTIRLFCSAKTWFMVFHVNDVLRRIRQPLKYNIFVEKHFVCVCSVFVSFGLDWLHRTYHPPSPHFFVFIFLLILRFARIVIVFCISLLSAPPAPPPTSFLATFPVALFISTLCCVLHVRCTYVYILLVYVKA